MNLSEEMQEAIRMETEHRCDVYTDGDWFAEKIRFALCDLLFPDAESCDGECAIDFIGFLRKALNEG
jgi:hypothetical protein